MNDSNGAKKFTKKRSEDRKNAKMKKKRKSRPISVDGKPPQICSYFPALPHAPPLTRLGSDKLKKRKNGSQKQVVPLKGKERMELNCDRIFRDIFVHEFP